MVRREEALRIARGAVDKQLAVDESAIRELDTGWFFGVRSRVGSIAGTNGLIVNMSTGRVFHLGSAFSVERDLALYDKGYQSMS